LLIVSTDNYYFVVPDNGVISLVCDVEEVHTVVEVSEEHYFLENVSKTFHGRDIMAPVAAWLTRGIDILHFGPEVENFMRLPFPKPKMVGDSLLKGSVFHIDRFGNVVTNISRQDFQEARAKSPGELTRIMIGKQEISGLKEFYAAGQKGELIALFGSADFLEIAQTSGSAARALGISRGAEVGVQLK
jgi:S-adenosylmethionine hydrolase